MKRRIFAAALATAMVLSLAACGGGNKDNTSASNPGSSDVSTMAPGASSSQPDASNPDGSQPDASNSDGSSGSGDASAPGETTFTLNKTEVTLNKAGATFQLRWTAEPIIYGSTVSFTSDKPEIATVAEDGTIKAVAPGKAVITVNYGDVATATCGVNCGWKEETKPEQKPEPKPDPKPDGSGSSSSGGSSSTPAPSKVDLSDFYTSITGKYQFAFMMEADADMLSNFYAGLSDLSLSQKLVYLCGMSPAPNGDFALIQVSDSKDVDKVKAILQARIDYMVGDGNGPGGAFYPMEQTTWEEYARIAVNGNYLMLIAHENCDDIVKEFNALF